MWQELSVKECYPKAVATLPGLIDYLPDPWGKDKNDPTANTINDDDFGKKTMFLNAYLIGKLNTTLHEKTVSVEHKNGF